MKKLDDSISNPNDAYYSPDRDTSNKTTTLRSANFEHIKGTNNDLDFTSHLPRGWHTDNPSGIIEVANQGVYGVRGDDGHRNKVIELEAHRGDSNLYTMVKTQAGSDVNITVEAAQREGYHSKVEVLINGDRVGLINPHSSTLKDFAFTVKGTGNKMRVEFKALDSDSTGILLDNISIKESYNVNDDPIGKNDRIWTDENAAVVTSAADLLANDYDPDGNTLTITAVGNAQHGTVTFDGTNVTFTPDAGFSGPAYYTYKVSDGHGGTDTAKVIVNVLNVNDTGDGNTPYYGENLITNGSFEDTSGIQKTRYGYKGDDGEMVGWSTADGNDIDIHNNERGGQVATDGRNWLDLEASPGNVNVGQNVQGIQEGVAYDLIFDVSDSAHLTSVDGVDENLVNVYWGGELVATIDPSNAHESNFEEIVLHLVGGAGDGSNRVSFEGTGKDDKMGAAVDNVRLFATELANQAPDAIDDVITVDQAGPVVIPVSTLLSNDVDPDGDALQGVSIQDAQNGTIVFDGENLIFTPAEGYSGPASFTYTISDGKGGVDTASVNFNIIDGTAPDAPGYAPDMTPASDTGISNTDDNTKDNTPTFTISDPGENTPTLYINGVKVPTEYDPATQTLTPIDAVPDGQYEAVYTFTDPAGNESGPSPSLPFVVDTTAPDAPGYAPDMTPESDTGISDTDDDTQDSTPTFTISDPGENTPTLYINGVKVPAEYDPNGQTLTPTDAVPDGQYDVSYTLTDPAGNESAPSPSLPFVVDTTVAENQAPVAVDDVITVDQAGPVVIPISTLLSNDFDPDGDALHGVSVQDVQNGTVSVEGENLIFTPEEGYTGPASFTYTISDGKGGVDTASVNFDITDGSAPAAPSSAPDMTYETDTGVSHTDNLTKDATPSFTISDPSDNVPVLYIDGYEVTSVYDPVTHTLTPVEPVTDGHHVVTYTFEDASGNESAPSAPLPFDIDTVPPVLGPVPDGGSNDTSSTAPNMTDETDTGVSNSDDHTKDNQPDFAIDLSEGDIPELYIDGVKVEAEFNAEAKTLTPVEPLTDGSHDVSYKLTDAAGNESPLSQSLPIMIDTVAPDAGAPADMTPETDTGVSDSDDLTHHNNPDFSIDAVGDNTPTLYIDGVNTPASFNPGANTLTPLAALPDGVYAISYTLTDVAGNESVQSQALSIEVSQAETHINTNPDAVDDTSSVATVGDVIIDPAALLHNDSDADGDSLEIISLQGEVNGAVHYDGTHIIFTPTAGYTGPASFTYTISDGKGGNDTATVNLTIAADETDGNRPPVAIDDVMHTTISGEYVISKSTLLSNDYDPDGDPLEVTINGSDNGTVTFTGNEYIFTPNEGYYGPASFTYTITDGRGGSDTASVNLTVLPPDTSEHKAGTLHFNDLEPSVDSVTPAGWFSDNPGGVIEVLPSHIYGLEGPVSNVLELERGPGDASNFYTLVNSTAGEMITLEFDYSARPGALIGDNSAINIMVNGEVLATVNSQTPGFTHYTYSAPGTGSEMRIEFQAVTNNQVGGLLDNIYLSADPIYMDGLPDASDVPDAASLTTGALIEDTVESAGALIDGTHGNDVLVGTAGDDTINGLSSKDVINGGDGNDTINAGSENDTVLGGDGNDVIEGGSGDDVIAGGAGDDVINAGSENDTVLGGEGNDVIDGGSGDDVISGGEGNDTLTGGIGADTFSWSLSDTTGNGVEVDTITDFNSPYGTDSIDLKDLLNGEANDAESLSSYIHFSVEGGSTTMHVSADGKFADSADVTANTTQQIEFSGVDLTAGGSMSDMQVIQTLLSNNQLITD